MITDIKIKKLREGAIIPTFGSPFAAGADLYANIPCEVVIPPHETVKIGTGFAIQCPHEYFGAIFARSGLATRQGLRPANAVGVIDEDYTGEIIVALHNDTDEFQKVIPDERIAQIIFLPTLTLSFVEVDDLEETERGAGGFGSTGV